MEHSVKRTESGERHVFLSSILTMPNILEEVMTWIEEDVRLAKATAVGKNLHIHPIHITPF